MYTEHISNHMKPNEIAKINQLYKQIDEQLLTISHLQDRIRAMQNYIDETKQIHQKIDDINSKLDKISKK